VRRKDGAWSYRVDLGPDPSTGSRRQIAKQGFRTRKAAEAALGVVLNAVAAGSVVSRSTTTTSQYLDNWLVSQHHRLRPTTVHGYKLAIARIRTWLGQVPVQALTPLQIERFYADLLREGGHSGQPLSAKTVRNSHVVLRKALADAERLGLVQRNAAAAARPPSSSRRELATCSSEDLREFFTAIRGEWIYPALVVVATTGMRRGEVLGLRWRDLDLDAAQLSVVQTLTAVNVEAVIGPTKTSRSRRTVYLDPQTVDVLREHRRRQREARLIAGPVWDSSTDLAFRDEVGVLLYPDWFTREFRRGALRRGWSGPHVDLGSLLHGSLGCQELQLPPNSRVDVEDAVRIVEDAEAAWREGKRNVAVRGCRHSRQPRPAAIPDGRARPVDRATTR
jgi:integrase